MDAIASQSVEMCRFDYENKVLVPKLSRINSNTIHEDALASGTAPTMLDAYCGQHSI